MTLENAALASFAASTTWSHMLRLYEYMEPESNSPQVEWRIVNTLPQYHDVTDDALVPKLLDAAKRWKSGSVRFDANDVVALTCPRSQVSLLSSIVPDRFRRVPILSYPERAQLSRLQRLRERALWKHRGRERIVTELKSPPAGTSWLWIDSDGAFRLPIADRIRGARFHQDELRRDASVLIQYHDVFGRLCDLFMNVGTSFQLFDTLDHFRAKSGLHPKNFRPLSERPRDIVIGTITVGFSPVGHKRLD